MKHFSNLVEETQPEASELVIGVLALQGDFIEHINVLRRLGVRAVPVRTPAELANLDGLIIPGGESTAIGKLAVRWGLLEPLHQFIDDGKDRSVVVAVRRLRQF